MSMEDLPVPLMVDILSRLPVKTIIHCKCVCKMWLDIVSDSYFVNLHMSRSLAILMIHFASGNKTGILKWVEVEDELDHHHFHHDPVMSLDLNPMTIGQTLLMQVGSVNGLICLRQHGYTYQSDHNNENTYICNPITREYMILPRLHAYRLNWYCFGVGSLSQEYKVLRICNYTLEAKVYTLDTGRWRSLGRAPYRLGELLFGTFLNGHAHWIVNDHQDSPENIYAFDFDMETFKLFPSPPSEAEIKESYDKSLGVLKGCLCLCDTYLFHKLKVWVMKEYGINKSWHKELVIQCSIDDDSHLLFVQPYIIEGLKDGTILMGRFNKALFVYCPRRNIIIKDPEIVNCNLKGFSYRPSFQRLQNFENERVHVST